MAATIQFTKSFLKDSDCVILPVVDKKISNTKDIISSPVSKKIKAVIEEKDGDISSFSAGEKEGFIWYVVVPVSKNASQLEIEKIGGKLFAHISKMKIKKPCVVDVLKAEDAAALANGFYLRSYEFIKYKTKIKDKLPDLSLKIACDLKANADRAFKTMKAISDGVFIARDFVNEPPNNLYPESYAAAIKNIFKGASVKITIFDEKKLEKMGAGALLAVGKGSERQPRLVVLEYDGRTKKNKTDKPLALVGKGVTFDTGGYSLKPRESMATMKMDMGGSAAVIGALKALVDNKINTYVVAAVALAENMIAGNAYRVDDVLASLSGQTIEICNTDAEGRLCLADALTYIQDKYDPKMIVDAATLTGACMGALGLEIAGVFSNNEKLQQSFWDNGKTTGDEFWPLPVNKDFDKLIDSDIADMRNLATSPYGGASTAAVFLQRFITNDRPWAHLDIAGTAWRKNDADLTPKGASGFGVRAFYHWVVNQ